MYVFPCVKHLYWFLPALVWLGCQSKEPVSYPPGEPLAVHLTPDDLYAADRVLDIQIQIKTSDWDQLRTQTRSTYDILGPDCFSGPAPDVFSYFPATVTIDGIEVKDVGVRKKGFQGSLDRTRPALKLKFDQYRKEQTFGGLKRMTLNNVKKDPSKIRTCLAYEVYRRAGMPASRCNFARMTVNGEDFGLYVHVEPIKKPMLRKHFDDDAEGNLYEGLMSDFLPMWQTTFDKKTNKGEDDWSDINAAVAALDVPDDELEEAASSIFNLDQALTYWALEVLIGYKDGYANRNNNYYVYNDALTNRFHFIPWGPDTTFYSFYDPSEQKPHTVLAHGHFTYRIYQNPLTQHLYLDKLEELLGGVWNEEWLLAEVDRLEALIEDALTEDELASMKADLPQIRDFISGRRGEMLEEWEDGPAVWKHTPSDPPCWEYKGTATGTASTTWGTIDSNTPLIAGTAETEVMIDGAPLEPVYYSSAAGDSTNYKTEGKAEIRVIHYMEEGFLMVIMMGIDPNDMIAGTTLPTDGTSVGSYLLRILPGSAGESSQSEFLGFLTGGTVSFHEAGLSPGDPISFTFDFEIYTPPEDW